MILTNGVQKLENINIMVFTIHNYTTKYISGKRFILPSALGKVYVTRSLIPMSYFKSSEYVFAKQNLRSFKNNNFINTRNFRKEGYLKMFFTFFYTIKTKIYILQNEILKFLLLVKQNYSSVKKRFSEQFQFYFLYFSFLM